jgi:hypothetical protein
VIYWSPSDPPLTTTYVSNTQVTAQVPAAYIIDPTSSYIYAYNPAPGGGSSGDVTFSVFALDPSISSVAPNVVVAGSRATPITVTGSNFMNGASVLWNNKKLPTTYTNSGQLQAQLTASQVAKPEIAQVSVLNPAPGGVSAPLNFNVSYPALVRILNIPANDLVWDPKAQRIYASLPSSFGTNGNSIAVIDPTTAEVTGYYFVGSEPNQLALSADSSYLYVGLNGNGSVQRMILPGFTPDINVSLGTSESGGPNTAGALQVSPGNSHTFAVVLANGECCGYGGTLEFFTDATLLSNSITYPTVSSTQFVNASTLYGYSNGTLIQVAVNSSGGTLTTEWNDTLSNSSNIVYEAGLIYGNYCEVFNPATGESIGDYDVAGGIYGTSNDLLPESGINSTFVVGTTPFFDSFGITSYNLTRFTPNAVINLSQFNGDSVTPSFISWGNNGVAFVVASGCCGTEYYQTILVQSSMMRPSAGKP